MKPIIFVRISSMKYYRGITDDDMPENGGSYVSETGEAHECYNFDAVDFEDGTSQCFGFAMLTGNNVSQIRIENIPWSGVSKRDEQADGVTVVWCAKAHGSNSMRVVGFYKNATVYRHSRYLEFDNGYVQEYNFSAKKEDCVLIPFSERFSSVKWYVPTCGKQDNSFGFGRSSIWYGGSHKENDKENEFVLTMLNSIESYSEGGI